MPNNRSLLVALWAIASPVHAEGRDEIIVTATRRPAPVADTAGRNEVISRADIDAQVMTVLPEAIGSAAVQAGGAGQQTSFFLDGANSRHVLALYDGIPLNDSASPNGQYDFGQDNLGGLERIEIVRGPAAAHYGSGAIGGVVNLIPRRGGESSFEPFGEAASGSLATTRLLLGAAGSSAALDYGVSWERFETKGYDLVPERMTSTGEPDGATIETTAVAARLPLGVWSVDVIGRHRTSSVAYDTFSGGAFFDLRQDDPDLQTSASQTLWRLGVERASAASTLRITGGGVVTDRADSDNGLITSGATSERVFVEAMAFFESGPHNWSLGVTADFDAIDVAGAFSDPLRADEQRVGAFLLGSAALSERVTATGALRLDSWEGFGVEPTASLGVIADLAALRLYLSAGTGFKSPSLSERFETSFFNIGNPALAPETSNAWEIGGEWRLHTALSLGGAYHSSRVENLIEYDFPQRRNINVGVAHIDGAEARATFTPFDAFSIIATYTWLDARNGLSGAQLPRRPEHSWRILASLNPTPRLNAIVSWSHVGTRTDVIYEDGGQFASAAGRADSFGIGAIAANYQLTDALTLFVRVDNLTDESYEQPNAFAGAPRRTLIGVRASFRE